MDEPTSRALPLARTLLAGLTQAGYHYQLAGSLALHAHGISGAAVTSDVQLFTEADYWRASDIGPLALAVEMLRQEGYTVEDGPAETVRAGTFPTLRVEFPDGHHPLRVRLQRMPQITAVRDIQGLPTAALADCLRRILNALHAGTGGAAAFIDFDALQAHAGQVPFDHFVQAFLQHKIRQDPSTRPVHHYEQFYARLARVIRHPEGNFRLYGHPAPAVLRQSVLQSGLRMLRATPGGSPLLQVPIETLQQQHLAQVVRRFESVFPPDDPGVPAGVPFDPGQAARIAERALAVEAAVLARTQAGQNHAQLSSRTHRSPHPHPHTHQVPGHGSSATPGR